MLFIHLDELYKTIPKNRLAKSACSGSRSVYFGLTSLYPFRKNNFGSFIFILIRYKCISSFEQAPKRIMGVRIGAHFTQGAVVRPAALANFVSKEIP